jgi:hypothetical protein
MIITIEKARGGYIIRTPAEDTDTTDDIEVIADTNSVHATCSLLWAVAEALGVEGSKYDKERIQISIAPGSKWISPEEAKTFL